MKLGSSLPCVALVGVLVFLVAMVIAQASELKNLRMRLALSEDALCLVVVELGKIRGNPATEGIGMASVTALRGPDNIARLRHDLLQLDGDMRQVVSGLRQYLMSQRSYQR